MLHLSGWMISRAYMVSLAKDLAYHLLAAKENIALELAHNQSVFAHSQDGVASKINNNNLL